MRRFFLGLFSLVTACMSDDSMQVTQPVVLGMTSTAPAAFDDGQTRFFQVALPVPLPMRRPTDDERRELGPSPPLPRAPYLKQSDVRIEVHFTLSNLDNAEHAIELLVDPWNEFVRYRPGVVVQNEDALPNFSGYQKFFVLGPLSRFEGTLTTDDMAELAIDLATAMAIQARPPAANAAIDAAALMNRAFNLQNRSNTPDPLLAPFMPAVVPGLTGFDLGLRSASPANVAVEITMDVADLDGKRVVPVGSTDPVMGPPGRILSPPAPAN